MELPQPRPFGTEGKNPSHDFLSLYSYSSFQHQDPRPSPGIYLKTHDFLQPLEKVGKNSAAKGENKDETPAVEKLPTSSVEQTLPGGIGTYTISHISNFNQRAPKPERTVYTIAQAASTERNGEVSKANSSCSSYSGGSFTLWGESMVKEKGASTVKENAGERHVVREPAEKLGRWSSERPLQAPFNNRSNFTSQSSSKQSGQKNQTFMEMMRSAKVHQEEEEDDDEDFVVKRDGSSQKGDLTVKVDEKSTDQKAITPRSKHSATEQRRRSKINDRFQILRDLIPHSDQKRDKASFLLEVIEYIQFLQEKVNKYEALYPGWNQEPTKLTPWRNNHGPGESMIDHSGALKNGPSPGLMFSGRFDDNNIAVTPTILPNIQNPVESDMSTGAAYKAMDNHPGLSNKSVPLPIPLQPNTFTPVGKSSGLTEPQRPISDAEDMSSHPQSQFWQNKPCTTTSDTPNDQEELLIEGGTINISSVYSQGLLNTLTQALQSSGVDLSQASISMQIDLGKRAISRLNTMTSSAKDHGDPSSSNRATAHSRVVSSGEDSDQAQKRLKTEKS